MKKFMCLLVVLIILGVGTSTFHRNTWRRTDNTYVIPINGPENAGQMFYTQQSPVNVGQQQPNRPTVEVQQVTAEWVCNNLRTGQIKFYGVHNVVTQTLGADDVQKLLNQGAGNIQPNVQQNNHNNHNNNPFLPKQPDNQHTQTTEKPNINGEGLIDIRLSER